MAVIEFTWQSDAVPVLAIPAPITIIFSISFKRPLTFYFSKTSPIYIWFFTNTSINKFHNVFVLLNSQMYLGSHHFRHFHINNIWITVMELYFNLISGTSFKYRLSLNISPVRIDGILTHLGPWPSTFKFQYSLTFTPNDRPLKCLKTVQFKPLGADCVRFWILGPALNSFGPTSCILDRPPLYFWQSSLMLSDRPV